MFAYVGVCMRVMRTVYALGFWVYNHIMQVLSMKQMCNYILVHTRALVCDTKSIFQWNKVCVKSEFSLTLIGEKRQKNPLYTTIYP